MDPQRAGSLGLGPIDQVAFVVADMRRALPRYEALFGPFELADAPLAGCRYRGRTVDCRLALAVNRSGPLEIELIEVVEGEAPHSEHLREHGEGLHHVRFRVEQIDAKLEQLGAAGYPTIFYKRFTPGVAFAYLSTPQEMGGSVIELLEL
jgi:catechol 2,3-dioxygenase-like lactoylglutathione lyase family enzyme